MTKLIKHLSIVIIAVLAPLLCIIEPKCYALATEKNITPASIKAMQSPTFLEVIDQNIYIFDKETNCILLRKAAIPSASENLEIEASLELEGLVAIEKTENGLIALTNNGGDAQISLVSKDLKTTTPFSLSRENYPLSSVIDISYYNNTLFMLTSSGEINKFTVSETALNQTIETITKATLYPDLEGKNITHISHYEDEMIIAATNGVYKLNLNSYSFQKVLDTTSITSLSYNGSTAFVLKGNNTLYSISSLGSVDTKTFSQSLSGLTATKTKVYLSSQNTHQVFEYNGASLVDMQINKTIAPTLFKVEDYIYQIASVELSLYLQPYSINPKLTVQQGVTLTIIGESQAPADFYFVLYSLNQENHYLYLKKADAQNTSKFSSTLHSFVAIRQTKVYSKPSLTCDSLNSVLATYPAQTKVYAGQEVIETSQGNFHRVLLEDGNYGYSLSSCLEPLKSVVELTLKCNAKTKRESTLFENANGTGEIIHLAKNTRIKLLEELSPNKSYIKASYEDENGIIYTGYILSDNIDPDGLSTLQVLGIILIVINLVVLSLIVVVKTKSKKWNKKEAEKV